MSRSKLLLFCFLAFLSNASFAQNKMPSYLEVIREFFSNYSHQREEEFDRIFLAKKKEGWYVNIVDIADHDKVKQEQLFWDIQKNNYVPLAGFGKGLSTEEIDEKIDSAFNSSDPPFLYGYQRCRYYGYDGWDRDMIQDFGGKAIFNDTLVEGLGRAYGAYSEKFLWNGSGTTYVPYVNESLVKKLGRLEIPNEKRIDSFIYYMSKSIDCYRELVKRNSGLKLLVGNSAMKLLNEQMHQYLQVSVAGYKDKLKKIIAELPANDTIAEQIGRAYLSTCPPNSIIITYGDNDTYPLWYVQEKKGYRKDVTVLNHSLLGAAPYINMLKRENKIRFSATPAFYGKERFDYFVYDESGPPNIIKTSLTNFLKNIHQRKYPFVEGTDTLPAYQVRDIDLKIDPAKFKTIAPVPAMTLLPVFNIELSAFYILLNDLMILDIINSNIQTRPIYFTSNEAGIIPSKYLLQEGALHRVLPLNETLKEVNLKVSISKIESYLTSNPKPILAVYYEPWTYYVNAVTHHSALFSKIINYYFYRDDRKKADEWASKYLLYFDPVNIHYGISDIGIAEALLRTSFQKKGVALMENIAVNLETPDNDPTMLAIFSGKDTYKNWLEYLKSILLKNNSSSDLLEKLIEKTEKEN